MSSFRNHRVIIASLFLPTTAVHGESGPPTPHNESSLSQRLPHSRQQSIAILPLPLKSIVDDLKDKSRNPTPALRSPTIESVNPFFKLTRFVEDSPSITSPPRKYQTTRAENGPTPRLQRKQSRSSSRRADSDSLRHSSSAFSTEAWHFEQNPHCNGGLKNAIDSMGDRLKKKLWVGTLGTRTDTFNDSLRKSIDQRMLSQGSSLPVWIPDAEFQSCYDEFCHQVLWPCLHYAVPDAPKTKLFYESASYKQYVAVNQRFADAIIANYQDGDIIWVNDYHLMLLPHLLRSSPLIPPSAPIGFFMHVAFPSSEIFRCLSVRRDLLQGLLGADLVGFQTANFARHFRQTVSRIMAYEALPKGIQVAPDSDDTLSGNRVERGRFVDVGVFPMGIDVRQLKEKKKDPEVEEWVQVLKQRYAGMKIVVGRDKLDEIQGVRQKLQAFEAFLDKYPQFQGKIVLIQVALQTTESNELAGGVADVVSRINSRFSTLTYQPVVFLHTQDLTFSQYLALLSVADAFIVTSLREGMALRTHEFVECQEGRYRPLVLSEFTGSYSYSGFRSCIAINPWDTRGTAYAIYQALTMSDEEARSRWEDLHNHVTTQTAPAFVSSFLTRCLRAHTEHFLQSDPSSTTPPLLLESLNLVIGRYKHSGRRLFFVDLEGSLWKRDLSRQGLVRMMKREVEIPQEVVHLLKRLAEGGRNEVWVLSGLTVGVLDALEGVGVVAENGCYIKPRTARGTSGEWIDMVSNFNLSWKAACLEILNYFTERTPGSFIEERQASMVWRFWTGDSNEDSADRQWARRQAAEAQNHIFDSLGERYGLRIIPGKNSFLVLPTNISRSTAVGAILHPGGPLSSPSTYPLSNASRRSSASAPYYYSPAGSPRVSPLTSTFARHGMGPWMPMGAGMEDSAVEDRWGGREEVDYVMVVSADERLLRRLDEWEGAETVSVQEEGVGRGTDAKWRVAPGEVGKVLEAFVGV